MTSTADPFAAYAVPEATQAPAQQDDDPFAAFAVADPTPTRELGDSPGDLLPVSPGPINEDAEREKDFRVRQWFERAQAANPAHEIEAYDLSRVSDAPFSMVRDRIDDFRKTFKPGTDARQWRLDNPDLYHLIAEQPHMAATVIKEQTRWRQGVNPDYEAYAKEHPLLSALESAFAVDPNDGADAISEADRRVGKTEAARETSMVAMQDLSHLTTGESVVDAATRSFKQNLIAKQGYERGLLDMTAPDSDKAQALRESILEQQQALGAPAYYGNGIGRRVATTIADTAMSQVDSTAALAAGAVVGAVSRRPQLGVQVAKIAGAATSFISEAGGAYNDMADTFDDQGKPIDKRIAFAAANAYGALAAAIETGMLGVEASGITALDAKRWATRMLTDKTRRGMLLDLAKTLTKNAAGEAGEEGAQQTLQLTIEWLAKSVSAGEVQSYDKDAALLEVASAAGQGALGSIVGIGGVTATANTLMTLGDSHRAGAHVAAIADIGKSDAARAAPKQVAAWIEAQQQADGRKVTHLYVDPSRLVEEAAKGGARADQVARELMGPEGPRRLQDALDVAGDAPGARATLEVPLAEYLEKWGGKPIAETLVEDMSTAPGLQTMREVRLFQSSIESGADAIANSESIDGASPEAAAIVGTIEEQLVAAGRPQREARQAASVVYAMADALARQSGRTTEEVLAEMPSITGVSGQQADGETLEQPSIKTMQAELRPASAEVLEQDYRALTAEEQQQRYFRDRNTGLQNTRALEVALKDPSRQRVAVFSMEGAKALNDEHGHGSVDGMLRRMASAARSLVPDASAKVRGDIVVVVRDEAHAQEIAAAMQATAPEIQITYDVGDNRGTLDATLAAISETHGKKRDEAQAEGTLAQRGQVPLALQGQDVAAYAKALTDTPAATEPTLLSEQHAEAFGGDAGSFETAHLDPSGLLNDDGFAQARANPKTRKKFVMSADLRGFAGMNNAFGREATDAIKAFFNERMFTLGAGAFDTANLHGDEYAAQGDDSTGISDYFAQAQDQMRRVIISERNEDGSTSLQLGLHFAYGIDSDEDIADRVKLKEAKQQQDAAGRIKGVERFSSVEEARDRISQYAADWGLGDPSSLIERRAGDLVRRFIQGRPAEAESGAGDQAVRAGADQVVDAAVERLKQGEDAPRGWIDIVRKGGQRQFRIFLSKQADASTFLHESAHAYFEMLADAASASDANERLAQDWAAARKWAGAAEGQALTVEQKEKLARGFEAYILEGKAPSSALAEAFASFRRWLVDIYKSMASLGVELNDDIRGVFDRMLATEQEIDRARNTAGLSKPVFSTPEEAGVDPKDFDTYLAAQERIRSDVIARTQRMIHEGELRAAKAFKTDEYRRLKKQFEDEWEQLPQVRAWRYVRLGEIVLPGGTVDRNSESGKLDRDAVVGMMGKSHPIVKRLTGRLIKGGEDPIETSDMFGFTSVRDMLETLARLPDKDTWVKSETERAMRDQHPEIDGEIADLQASIQKLLHEDTFDSAERDWQLIKARTRDTVTIEALKRSAREKVDNQAAGRLDPGVVLNRERTFATQTAQAIAEGNFELAMAFAHRRLLHKYMWRELVDAKSMRDKFVDLVGDLQTDKHRARLGQAGPEYRDVVDSLLESVFATPERESDERRRDLGELLQRMDADGNSVAFDEDFIGELLRKPRSWRELKVSELQIVLDALRNIKAAARNITTALVDGKRIDRAKFGDELIASADANVKRTGVLPSSSSAETFVQSVLAGGAQIDGYLLRPETMLEWLGGDNQDSPWHRLVKMLQDAKHKQSDLVAKTVKPMSELFDNIPRSVRRSLRDRIDGRALFPNHRKDLAPPSRRYELLMLALNAGNESNLERVLEGRGISPTELRTALAQLTKAELDWVQSVWDQAESLWPLMRELEERDTGLAPPKIAPTPMTITTSDGKQVALRGGYFPAVYDGRVSSVGERTEIRNAADFLDVSLSRPSTNRSHTKKRAERFADVISLEPATIQSHFVRVTHDIAYRETIRSAANIFLDPRIKQTLREKLGAERAKIFEPWLRDIGRLEAAQAEDYGGRITKLMRQFRANIPIAVLGHAVDNFIADTTGLITAAIGSGLSKKHYAAALAQFAASGRAARELALSKSGELRSRGDDTYQGFQRRVRSLAQGRVAQVEGVIKEHAFFFAEQIEKATVTPVWLGAYRQGIAEGRTEEKAIDFADSLVRRFFPSKNVVDKSAIQRDKGVLGNMMMFVGFANLVYNQYRRIWQPVIQAEGFGDTAMAASAAMLKHVALAIVIGPLSELLVGHGPEPDEEWEQWFLRKLLIANLLPVPLLGGAVETAMSGKPSNRSNPGFAAIEQMWKVVQKAADDDADAMDVIIQTVKAYGYLRGIPSVRPTRWLQYLLEGEYDNAGGIPSGLLYGNREEQPLNPISALDQ